MNENEPSKFDLRRAEPDSATPNYALTLLRGHCYYDRGMWKNARQSYARYLKLRSRAPDQEDIRSRIAICDRHVSGASTDF